MLVNSSALTVGMLLSFYSTSSYAQDEEKILKKLENKYDIDNPYRHKNLETNKYNVAPRQSKDLTTRLEAMIQKQNATNHKLNIKMNQGASSDMSTALKNANSVASTQIMPSVNPSTSEVNVKLNNDRAFETYRDQNGEIKVRLKAGATNELKPVSVSADQLYSSEINHDKTDWEGQGTYGDEEALYQAGRDSNSRLRSSSNQTTEAVAYRTILDNAQSGAQQTVPANLLTESFTTLDDLESTGSGFFNSCSSTKVVKEGGLYKPEIETKNCQRIKKDNPFHCEVERKLKVPVMVENQGLTSCGVGCYEFEIGKAGNNNLNPPGSCGIFQDSKMLNLNLTDGMELESISVDGYVDDHIEFTVDGKLAFSLVDGVESYSRPLPSTSYSQCENGGKREKGRWYYSGDKTSGFKRHIQSGKMKAYKIGWSALVGGKGEYLGTVQLRFKDTTGEGFGQVIKDSPSGCYNATGLSLPNNVPLNVGGQETSQESTSILEDPSAIPSSSHCKFDNYQTIRGGSDGFDQPFLDAAGPFYPGDSENISWKVNLEGYKCDPFKGEKVCVTKELSDGSSEEVCRSWEEIKSTGGTCDVYEGKNECVEIATECTDGFTIDGWNYCLNETVTYECDTGHNVGFKYETSESSCDGMLPCSGGDCSWGEKEKNENFFKAAAIANVMEQIPGEASCDVPGDVSTCRIFEGERQYCSWATASDWGNDCCEAPEGIDFLDYLNMTQLMLKFENQQMGGVFTNPAKEAINGAWTTVSDTVTSSNAWQSVSSYYTSAVETLTGNAATAVPGAASSSASAATSTVAEAGLGPMTQYIYQVIYDALPEELGKLLFSTTTAEGSNQAVVNGLSDGMASAANFIGTVMFWYSMYQLAQLVGSLLTACDETDSDTALKLEMRQCYAVEKKYCAKKSLGICYMKRQDYCCYGSILSRIVMEQAHVLLNKDMTQCAGLTHEELNALDFNQIDLSEWIGVMIESNLIPESNEDDLSASGRYENSLYRETPTERTKNRTKGAAAGAKKLKEQLNKPLDCSQYPRPPVCDYGFNIDKSGGN